MGDRIPQPQHRRHRWNRTGKWGSHLSRDIRTCLDCGLVVRKAPSEGWRMLVPAPARAGRYTWRWRIPPCFGIRGGAALRALNWNGRPAT